MVSIKSYAKLNLTLNILGVEKGFHNLDSIVTTIDLYDNITLTKRNDKNITIKMFGEGSESIPLESNNAFKSARLFIEKFNTNGVDIEIQKNIPLGLGVGGSSADSAGVLNGLKKLYETADRKSLSKIADSVGSDNRYMLKGGYARLFKRGNRIERIDSKMQLYFLLVAPNEGVSTSECYKLFDDIGTFGGNSEIVKRALQYEDMNTLSKNLNNSLLLPAKVLSKSIEAELENLSKLDPLAVNMTGSGSGVYALFENSEKCLKAKQNYKGNSRVFCVNSIIPQYDWE